MASDRPTGAMLLGHRDYDTSWSGATVDRADHAVHAHRHGYSGPIIERCSESYSRNTTRRQRATQPPRDPFPTGGGEKKREGRLPKIDIDKIAIGNRPARSGAYRKAVIGRERKRPRNAVGTRPVRRQ